MSQRSNTDTGITYREHLILRATIYWMRDEDIPLDLHVAMQAEGLIVKEIKRQFEEDYL